MISMASFMITPGGKYVTTAIIRILCSSLFMIFCLLCLQRQQVGGGELFPVTQLQLGTTLQQPVLVVLL